jgi:ABC-type multidrug transport system ATPase subunit
MMFFDFLLYGFLAWYADATLPSRFRQFGIALPWYFPCSPRYYRGTCDSRRSDSGEAASDHLMPSHGITSSKVASDAGIQQPHNNSAASYIEELDNSLKAKVREGKCVSVRGLRKEFSTPDGIKVAVDNLDLDLTEGSINVILGQNGAGKSTTISMLTGMIPPSAGSMNIWGKDVASDLAAIRQNLGVCPQEDILWPELTVREHLEIYAALKKVPTENVKAEIEKALKDVGLTEKDSVQAGKLSGGQKRKLSVCIALMGGSRVIFLDEPTSGMDPYSRRSTWQILQNAREGRVMVLTTHFMDEADLLGDRIAIMSNGELKCAGSPMFLKKRFGVGYLLSMVRDPALVARGDSALSAATASTLSHLQSFVPEATVSSDVGAELVIRLPLGASATFPAMLTQLDMRLNELGILSYGIGVTTLEDVFLKVATGQGADAEVGEDAPTSKSNSPRLESGSASGSAIEMTTFAATNMKKESGPMVIGGKHATADLERATSKKTLQDVRDAARAKQEGFRVHIRHFFALLAKRWNVSKRDVRALIFQLFIPVIMVAVGLALLKAGEPDDPPGYQMSTAQFNVDNREDPNVPAFPNRIPYFSFKSTGGPNWKSGDFLDTAAVGQDTLTPFFAGFPTANASFDGMAISAADAAKIGPLGIGGGQGDPWNFVTNQSLYMLPPPVPAQFCAFSPSLCRAVSIPSSPNADYLRMSSYLLSTKGSHPASRYGAYIFTTNTTIMPMQGPGLGSDTAEVTYTVFHNTTAKHSAPIFMNLANSRLYSVASGDPAASITTRSHPLPFTKRQNTIISAIFSFSSAAIIILAFAFIPASYAVYVVKERECSAKHQQLISGVSIPAYWLSTFVWDTVTYLVPMLLSIMLCYIFKIEEFTGIDRSRQASLFLLFWLYGLSIAGFTYCISFCFRSHSTAQNVILFVNVGCMILMIASLIMSQIESTCRADEGLKYIYRFLPGFGLGNGLISLSFLELLPAINAACDRLNGIQVNFRDLKPYNALDVKATGTNLIYMAILAGFYLFLAIMIDVALAHPRIRLWFQRDPKVKDAPFEEDTDVTAERDRVSAEGRAFLAHRKHTENKGPSQGASAPFNDSDNADQVRAVVSEMTDVIQVDRLRKVYKGGKVAVRDLSFSVGSGEIFGFLGINGAGKTTTLQTICGDVLPSSGTARLGGYDIINEQPDVRRMLGYCPQWDALLELMTTREHLELYARIKGISEHKLKGIVDEKLAQLDLTAFAHKKAGTLSGGNKRKLSVAVALVGSPPIVVLDEPSTGMDPYAKRKMWSTIADVASTRRECSIILTTHSMEECEALSNRVGILVGGRLRCLGSIQHIKNKYGRGFMAEVKLEDASAGVMDAIVARIHDILSGDVRVSSGTDPLGYISRAQCDRVAAAMGRPARSQDISESGTGWALNLAFQRSLLPSIHAAPRDRVVPITEFAEWWAAEDMAAALIYFVNEEAFPGAELLERQGTLLRFRLPAQKDPLGTVFARFEDARHRLCIRSYALGQTTLEQIFNNFAAQQDEEKNVARGLQNHAEQDADGNRAPAL